MSNPNASTQISKASESFIQSLKDADINLKSKLRVVKRGVFIPEDQVEVVIKLFSEWLIKNKVSIKSDDKITLRIFSVDNPPLYYLPEGNYCLSGFLAPFEGEILDQISVKKSMSALIDASTYIHPKDPFLLSSKNFRVKSSPQFGTAYELIDKDNKTFLFKEAALKLTLSLLKESKKFSNDYPELMTSMRDSIAPIIKLLSISKLVADKKKIFVPDRYKTGKFHFRLISNLVFVTSETNEVLFAYELRGKNFLELLDQELNYIRNTLNKKYLDIFEVYSNSRDISGSVKIKGKPVSIEKRALNELVQNATISKWLRGKLGDRFSLSDVILAISSALKFADWVDVSKLGENPDPRAKPKLELKYTPWTFSTVTIYDKGAGQKKGREGNRRPNRNEGSRTKIIRFVEGTAGFGRRFGSTAKGAMHKSPKAPQAPKA